MIIGAVVGFFVTAPLVAEYATSWWWLSAPLLVVYAGVLWRWGLPFFSSEEDVAKASLAVKIGGILILLGYTFVGITLLVFLAILAAQHWVAVAAAFLLLALMLPVLWFMGRDDDKKARETPAHREVRIDAEAQARAEKALGLGQPAKPDDLVR